MVTVSTFKIMPSKFKGMCMHCGIEWEAGDEFKWHYHQRLGYHVNCPTDNAIGKQRISDKQDRVQYRQDIASVSVKTITVDHYNVPSVVKLFNGKFTIPYNVGDNVKRHVTVWITTRGSKHHFPHSRRIRVLHLKQYVDIAYITVTGELHFLSNFFIDPTMTARKESVIKKAVEILVLGNDQESYGMYFALLSRRCWRCGKVLTNPETLKLTSGCGPICDRLVANAGIDHSKT